jgi:hypothetical protein
MMFRVVVCRLTAKTKSGNSPHDADDQCGGNNATEELWSRIGESEEEAEATNQSTLRLADRVYY